MADVIWSCPDCDDDLEDDDRMFWCPVCEHMWLPAEVAIDDPPEYEPEVDDE